MMHPKTLDEAKRQRDTARARASRRKTKRDDRTRGQPDRDRTDRKQPPKQRAPLKRKKPLAQVGKRRRRDRYAEARAECVAIVKARDVTCQATRALVHCPANGGFVSWVPERWPACGGPLDVHEVTPRGRGGDALDPAGCILVCRPHHDWIHRNPIEATALGLLSSAYPGRNPSSQEMEREG